VGGELHFILGSDSLLQMASWHEPEAILKAAKLIVLARPDFDITERAAELPEYIRAGLGTTVLTFAHPKVKISGSQIRQELKQGKSPRSALPTAVLKYIQRHQLYREG
jgi:nicotinate-nucleotide adenylyltransferase